MVGKLVFDGEVWDENDGGFYREVVVSMFVVELSRARCFVCRQDLT